MKEESSAGSCNVDKIIPSFDFVYGTQKLENYSDIENILYPLEDNEEVKECNNVANYVLSSGRWTVNKDSTQHGGTMKPTIDQEFEQNFSMLML
ncbi:unnamed protein product [Cochlearia groenlandica]